jgi:ribonuclease HI
MVRSLFEAGELSPRSDALYTSIMPSYSREPAGNRELFSSLAKSVPEHHLVAHIDGGARGNPGPAGYGVVVEDEAGHKVATLSEYLGHQTNNFAEYQGLIAALEFAVSKNYKALKVISDSELMVRQIKGIYKVKNGVLQDLHARAKELIAQLEWFSIGHVLRGHNQEADLLANAAMDKGSGRARATESSIARRNDEEFEGVVRGGKIELLEGEIPEGTRVQIRVKR